MSRLQGAGLRVRLGGRTVLDGVDVVLEPGRVTAVLGPNGAGKSTLLACLAGLRRPDGGAVRLDERSLLAIPARERARRIAFLPQTPEVAWAVDVRTLVGLGRTPHAGARGLSEEDRGAVERAMAAADVTAFAERDVTTLSGGERARVLIARALAGEPEHLLADEPLAGLDPAHQLDALDLFRRLAGEGAGVTLTLHDLSLALRSADTVLVLAAGQVLAHGAPETALTPDVIARAFGIRVRIARVGDTRLVEVLGRADGADPIR